MILIAISGIARYKGARENPGLRLLFLISLPLIGTFIFISLFRNTLPHWSGPAYLSLIPLPALWIRKRQKEEPGLFPLPVLISLGIMVLIVGTCIAQITTGFIKIAAAGSPIMNKGKEDISLQIVGWDQLGAKFPSIAAAHEKAKEIPKDAPIVTYRWFPAANLDYYVARHCGKKVLVSGDLEAIHKYAWINRFNGGFRLNSDAWYITSSLDFEDPGRLKPLYFGQAILSDTVSIYRNGKVAYYFFIYRLKNLQTRPPDPFQIR